VEKKKSIESAFLLALSAGFAHNTSRKVAIREFADFHGRRSHSGAAAGQKRERINRFRSWLAEPIQSGGPAKVLGEGAVKNACRKQWWQHLRGRRSGEEPWPSQSRGHARGRRWKAPDLWPRCVLRGIRCKAGSWSDRNERGTHPGLREDGRATRVSGDADEMGQDRRRETNVPHLLGLERAGPLGFVTLARESVWGDREPRMCPRVVLKVAEVAERCLLLEPSTAKATSVKTASEKAFGWIREEC
jgi:hypothetical protein